VIQGVEYEELFQLDEAHGCLLPDGTAVSRVGDVSGFARDDIQRVRDIGERTAGSIYVYGTSSDRLPASAATTKSAS
jgi:hypothetical protein